ncbi:MAG TPA: arylesterase [Noviherbaspirillum sp.]
MVLTLALFAEWAYSASKTVLVLGDSLSAEYGLVRGMGWVPLLEKRLQAERIDAAIVNASISGETTSGGKSRLPALLQQHHPAIVIIELGGNDGLRGLPIASVTTNLRTMINAAQQAGAKVLLIGMHIPPNYGRDYTEKFSTMYMNLSLEKKVPLTPFLLEGIADKPQLFQADRIHPIAEAQTIMLNNIWPQLKQILLKQ